MQKLKVGRKVYRLRDGKHGTVQAMWRSGIQRYAFVEFDQPHVPDSYENQRDLCTSPVGHVGGVCIFCGCELSLEMRGYRVNGSIGISLIHFQPQRRGI